MLRSAATPPAGAGFLVVWLPADARGSRPVLARDWHGYLHTRGPAGASNQCQPCLDGPSLNVQQSICLQSTFEPSVTVAGLGLNTLAVRSSRPLSDLVVVRCSGQPDPLTSRQACGCSRRVCHYCLARYRMLPLQSRRMVKDRIK